MKRILSLAFVGIALFLTGLSAQEQPFRGFDKKHSSTATMASPDAMLETNRFHLRMTSVGTVTTSYTGSSWEGAEVGMQYNPIYDHGLWVTAKRNGIFGVAASRWATSFVPGPVVDGQPATPSLRYRPYCVTLGESPELNPDIAAWPSDLGAPTTPSGSPLILGNQMAWTVYNGADTTNRPLFFNGWSLAPRAQLPVEIRQTEYAHFGEWPDTTVWANAIFLQWGIYNKGPDVLDSVFVSIWTDIDFIEAHSTIPAVDTARQLAYCWYNKDSSYAAIGYTLVYGPSVPSPGDTATAFGVQKAGYRNLPMSSFSPILREFAGQDWRFPKAFNEFLSVSHGLSANGTPMIDSSTGLPTLFPAAGDPLTNTGMVFHVSMVVGEGGFVMTTGPFSLAPGDSQWMMIALAPTEKSDGVDAITRLRSYATQIRSLPYDSLVTPKPRRNIPIGPPPVFEIPRDFVIRANYPNPFNGRTMFPVDLPEDCTVRIDIFDMLGRRIETPVNASIPRGYQTLPWYPTAPSSGIYFARIDVRSLESSRTWSGFRKLVYMK